MILKQAISVVLRTSSFPPAIAGWFQLFPSIAEKLATFGFVPNPMTPAALASLIDSDIAAYAAMVKRTRISAD